MLQILSTFEFPWSVVSALAFGLCDYQLGPGGAAAYWREIHQLLESQRLTRPTLIMDCIGALGRRPVGVRLAEQKAERVRRLLSSDLLDWCRHRDIESLGHDAEDLWNKVADAMGQARDAKTIAFAMKCFDLLHRISVGRYARLENVPIIVDLRIARISLSAGLIAAGDMDVRTAVERAGDIAVTEHALIIERWRTVQKAAGGISLFRVDSLAWQLAEPIYTHRANRQAAGNAVVAALIAHGVSRDDAVVIASELTDSLR